MGKRLRSNWVKSKRLLSLGRSLMLLKSLPARALEVADERLPLLAALGPADISRLAKSVVEESVWLGPVWFWKPPPPPPMSKEPPSARAIESNSSKLNGMPRLCNPWCEV